MTIYTQELRKTEILEVSLKVWLLFKNGHVNTLTLLPFPLWTILQAKLESPSVLQFESQVLLSPRCGGGGDSWQLDRLRSHALFVFIQVIIITRSPDYSDTVNIIITGDIEPQVFRLTSGDNLRNPQSADTARTVKCRTEHRKKPG